MLQNISIAYQINSNHEEVKEHYTLHEKAQNGSSKHTPKRPSSNRKQSLGKYDNHKSDSTSRRYFYSGITSKNQKTMIRSMSFQYNSQVILTHAHPISSGTSCCFQ